jgi:hypothetical protein
VSDAEKIKVLTEALRFYANRENYFAKTGEASSALWKDFANTAINALNKTNE